MVDSLAVGGRGVTMNHKVAGVAAAAAGGSNAVVVVIGSHSSIRSLDCPAASRRRWSVLERQDAPSLAAVAVAAHKLPVLLLVESTGVSICTASRSSSRSGDKVGVGDGGRPPPAWRGRTPASSVAATVGVVVHAWRRHVGRAVRVSGSAWVRR